MARMLLDNIEAEGRMVASEVEAHKRTPRSAEAALRCTTVLSVLSGICCKQYAALKLRRQRPGQKTRYSSENAGGTISASVFLVVRKAGERTRSWKELCKKISFRRSLTKESVRTTCRYSISGTSVPPYRLGLVLFGLRRKLSPCHR